MGQGWQTWFFQFLMVPVLFLSSLIKSSCSNSLDKIICSSQISWSITGPTYFFNSSVIPALCTAMTRNYINGSMHIPYNPRI